MNIDIGDRIICLHGDFHLGLTVNKRYKILEIKQDPVNKNIFYEIKNDFGRRGVIFSGRFETKKHIHNKEFDVKMDKLLKD